MDYDRDSLPAVLVGGVTIVFVRAAMRAKAFLLCAPSCAACRSLYRPSFHFAKSNSAFRESEQPPKKKMSLAPTLHSKGSVLPSAGNSSACLKNINTLGTMDEESRRRPYSLVKTYPICATSGRVGPKRRFGDEQVPEGFYELDWFNPQSNFYLSLHVSYPNKSDRILGSRKNPVATFFCMGTA
jgi:hypothetical protein